MIYQLFFMFFILSACSEDFSGGSRTFTPNQQEQQPVSIPPIEFRTRLRNNLLIEGDQCRGGETTESNGHGRVCEAGQYLVYIDNVNTCDDSGRCSNFNVIPIVAELVDINARIPGQGVFDIRPISIADETQRQILDTVSVNADSNGNGTVFFK